MRQVRGAPGPGSVTAVPPGPAARVRASPIPRSHFPIFCSSWPPPRMYAPCPWGPGFWVHYGSRPTPAPRLSAWFSETWSPGCLIMFQHQTGDWEAWRKQVGTEPAFPATGTGQEGESSATLWREGPQHSRARGPQSPVLGDATILCPIGVPPPFRDPQHNTSSSPRGFRDAGGAAGGGRAFVK